MKKILTVILCASLIFIMIGLLPVHGETEIYDSVMRLHVVANSDGDADQKLKLDVRDRIIELMNTLCADCETLDQTRAVVEENLSLFLECAYDEVARQGFDLPVRVTLGEEEYPTKTYASLCFPSGRYLSLQVLIGEAQGENWWCVLFPPLCLEAATPQKNNEDAFISVGLTTDQYKVITETNSPKYEARFKLLEIIEDTLNDQ